MPISEVTAILEISNTRHGPAADLDEPSRRAGQHDHLSSAEEARRYLGSRGMLVPEHPPDEEELAHLRQVRDVAQAIEAEPPHVPSAPFESLLAHYAYRLSTDGSLIPVGSGWERFIASAIPGLLALLATRDRLRRCENAECGWLFIDRSRNRSRQWCDMGTCGSRAKMARYRRRRRAITSGHGDPEPGQDAAVETFERAAQGSMRRIPAS